MIIDVVDNFDLMIDIMLPNVAVEKPDSNAIFQVFIIRRNKDTGNSKVSQHVRVIKCYFVHSFDELIEKKDEIVKICNATNSRAYLNPGAKSLRNITREMMDRLTGQLYDGVYADPNRLVNSIVASSNPLRGHRWFHFDCDTQDKDVLQAINKVIEECKQNLPLQNIVSYSFPSRSGVHIFTSRFNKEVLENELINFNFDPVYQNGSTVYYYRGKNVLEIKENSNVLLYACTNTDFIK